MFFPSLARRRAIAATVVALACTLPVAASAEVVLRAVPSSDLKILDPIWTTATITRSHGYMIYDTLFAMDDKGAIQPQMVDQYKASDDRKTWTFTLRPGLMFHDGTPVTAQDVIASLARWGKRDPLGQRLYAALQDVTPEGTNGFRMRFKEPFAAVLDALGKSTAPVPFIMPKRVAETPADKQIDDLTGSGPFMLAKADFRPGDRVTYHKNPAYVPRKEPASGLAGGKRVHVDRVDWMMLADPQTQANALLNGEVDLVEVTPAGSHVKLRTDPKIEMLEGLRPGGEYTAHFNHKAAPFNNPKIVRAAMLAVNQEALLRAQVTYRDLFKTCTSIYLCGTPYASEQTGFFTGKPQFDEARKLLKEAGYDGTPVVVLVPSDVAFLRAMPNVYGQLLKQAGFNVDVQSTDWSTLVARRVRKDPVDKGGWSVFVTFWGAEDAANPLTFTPLNGSGDKGFFGWPEVPQLETLKTQFMDTTDPAARKQLAEKMQAVALEAGVLVPLGNAKGPIPVRKGVIRDMLQAPGSMTIYWNLRKAP